jgi:hypothetical protein
MGLCGVWATSLERGRCVHGQQSVLEARVRGPNVEQLSDYKAGGCRYFRGLRCGPVAAAET